MSLLFGDSQAIARRDRKPPRNSLAARLHATLLRLYGSKAPERCGRCQHLQERRYGGTYFKCARSGRMTHSEASDWRKKWEACGLFYPRQQKG